MIQIVKFDDVKQRAIKIVIDPVEVYGAMRQGITLRAIDGLDLSTQTIKGIPIPEIYRRNTMSAI